jgi:GT2 family glycosyltransferase
LYAAQLGSNFEVIVVDNGSTDGTHDVLRDRFPEVRRIQNRGNVGLSRASNQGIGASRGRYVLLLNDDTIVDGTSLDTMVQFLDSHPGVAAVGGRLLNPDGSVQAGYRYFPSLTEEFLIATRIGELFNSGFPCGEDDGHVQPVDWLGSACLLLRRQALREVGLLDEEYFIYGDEVDLQFRLHGVGWCVYYLPSVHTIHYGGRSMDRWRRRKMVYRGKMLFYRKHYGRLQTAVLRLMFAWLSAAKLVVWFGAVALPAQRERAQREIRSNCDIIALCSKLAY